MLHGLKLFCGGGGVVLDKDSDEHASRADLLATLSARDATIDRLQRAEKIVRQRVKRRNKTIKTILKIQFTNAKSHLLAVLIRLMLFSGF